MRRSDMAEVKGFRLSRIAAVIAVGDRESLGATAGRGGGHVWATIDVGLPPAMIGRVASDG